MKTIKSYLFSISSVLVIACITSCGISSNSASTKTASNADTSNWKGKSSDGTTSLVSQTSTGDNTYSFIETWTKTNGSKVETKGTGVYDAVAKTNVYTYTKPTAAVVKVNTEEMDNGNTTIDTVTKSNSDLFSVGEKITYTKQP